jgi:glycerophosphoryl diester phosphodiesterase
VNSPPSTTRARGRAKVLAAISYSRLCELAGHPVPRVADVMTLIAGKVAGHLDLKDTGGEEQVVEMALGILGPARVAVLITNRPADAVAMRSALPEASPAASPGP